MFSIALSLFAILAPAAHADPGQLNPDTRKRLIARLDEFRRKSIDLKCADPYIAQINAPSSSEMSEFASIVDQIEAAEIKRDFGRYDGAVEEALKSTRRLGSIAWSTSHDTTDNLYRMIRADHADKTVFNAVIPSVKDRVKDMVFDLDREIDAAKKLIESKTFPLSLRGQLENIVEKAAPLVESYRNTLNSGFKENGEYTTTIAGNMTAVELQRKLIDLVKVTEQARLYYEKKQKEVVAQRDLNKCPAIIAKERAILSVLRSPSKEVLVADAKRQEADLRYQRASKAQTGDQQSMQNLMQADRDFDEAIKATGQGKR